MDETKVHTALFSLQMSKTLAEQFIHIQNNNPVHCHNIQLSFSKERTTDIPIRVVNKAW